MASTFHRKWRSRLRDEEYEYALDALNKCLSQSSCLTFVLPAVESAAYINAG